MMEGIPHRFRVNVKLGVYVDKKKFHFFIFCNTSNTDALTPAHQVAEKHQNIFWQILLFN